MARDLGRKFNPTDPGEEDCNINESFVKKVGSRVSGLIPLTLTKWFSREENKSSVRRREDDDEDDGTPIQPPSKKAKIPTTPNITYNNFSLVSIAPSTSRTTNSVSKNDLNHVASNVTVAGPTPGPSGIKARKLNISRIKDQDKELLLNGDKDSDSGDSTSGYSSIVRIESRERISENTETRPSLSFTESPKEALSRSLFEERGGPASRINTSLSSRRPSFNASTFGSPSFVDKTLCTKRVLDSPFYSGRTIYGGASAYGRRLGHTGLDFKYSVKNPVQVKPVNDKPINDSTTLSKTARRILDTLEQYATPASDAVKIPPPTKRSSNKGLISKYIGVNPYIRKEKQPSNKELHVPTIPDLMKMKEQLQSSTEAVRKIATSSKSDVCREESEPSTSAACEYNNEEYKIPTVNENISKHSNKIKTKITAVRHKVADSAPEEVKLPNVVLPITTLPKFDFSLQPPTSFVKYDQSKPQILSTTATSKASEKEVCIREGVQAQHHSNTAEYKFSIPLIVAQNSKTVISINNFKFSKPIFEKQHKNNALNFKTIENMDFKPKRSISKNNGDIQKAQNLLEHGSVMDILGKKASNNDSLLLNKFKIQPGQWECTVCLIRNQADAVKCVACETVRKVVEPKVDNKGSTLNNLFMKTPELWTCESCKVQNKVEDSKCFACTTPRYGSQIQPLDINKFKPSSDTWECPTCLIRNKKSVEKCVACETSNPTVTKISSAKPANFGDAFKKQSNEWECESCMVKNSNDKLKCQCCEAPKPGTSVVTEKGSSLPKFSFGLDKAVVGNFKFGINPTVATSSSNSSNAALIFGQSANQISSTNATFTFGITASAAGGKKDTLSSQEGDKRQPESAKTGDILIAPTSNICDSKAPELAPSKDNGTGLTKLTEQSNLATSKTKVEVAANINNSSSILPGKGNSGLGLTNNSKENSLSATPYTFGNTPNNSSSILPKTTKEDILKPAFTSTTTTTTHLPTTSIFQNTNPFTASFKGASNTNQPTQEVKPFTFGSSQPQQTLKLLELPNSQKVAEPAKPFSFGTSSINKQQNPTFGAGGFGENLQTSPSPATFNTSTPSVTSFGNTQQTQNGGFSFGGFGNNTASKTGFTFGNTNQSNQQQAFSGFNFGSTSVAPSTGFNFGAATPTVTSFNADIKPKFNFTGGAQPEFSAQPTDGNTPLPKRPIKKAVRRTLR